MTLQIFFLVAGLMGAAGVALAAASAHAAPGAGLDSAGYFLLFHAPAVMVLALAHHQGVVIRPLGIIAAGALALGAALFAGDLALRAFAGSRLFAMAAPAGGLILILGWLVATAAAVRALLRLL
jgi:uncharacterized membrane protein YgdD (TMEM256/DUF423 family)